LGSPPSAASSLPYCFFQAEDGIRDRNVTGVQTCALPISAQYFDGDVVWSSKYCAAPKDENAEVSTEFAPQSEKTAKLKWNRIQEIGRASCRERGGVGGADERGKRSEEGDGERRQDSKSVD